MRSAPSGLGLSPEQKRSVRDYCHQIRQQGRLVFPGDLYLFMSFEAGERLRIKAGKLDYEEYLACSMSDAEWRQKHGIAGPVSPVSMACVTIVEGQIILGKRGRQVAECAGMYHVVPAGHVHPPTSLVDTLICEAEEELGLRKDDLGELYCIGLCRSSRYGCVDVVCRMELSLGQEELWRRVSCDAWEHESLTLVDSDQRGLARWLIHNGSNLTDPGHAALVLEGLYRFGSNWLRDVWHCL